MFVEKIRLIRQSEQGLRTLKLNGFVNKTKCTPNLEIHSENENFHAHEMNLPKNEPDIGPVHPPLKSAGIHCSQLKITVRVLTNFSRFL